MASETSLYKQLDRSMPFAPLAIIALPSAREMGEKVSSYISMFRKNTYSGGSEIPYHDEYYRDSYLVDVLLERVCGYDYMGETNIVDVYIRYLRSKIDDVFGFKMIQTVRGVGYVIKSKHDTGSAV